MLGQEAVEAADHPLLALYAGQHLPRFGPHREEFLLGKGDVLPTPPLAVGAVGVKDALFQDHDLAYLFQGKAQLIQILDVLDKIKRKLGVKLPPPVGQGAGFQEPQVGVVLDDPPGDPAQAGYVAQGVEGG